MIQIKLSELMGKKKMTRKYLSELIGVRPNTIGDYYKGDVKKVDLSILDKMCVVFNCEINDILEYIPEENAIKEAQHD